MHTPQHWIGATLAVLLGSAALAAGAGPRTPGTLAWRATERSAAARPPERGSPRPLTPLRHTRTSGRPTGGTAAPQVTVEDLNPGAVVERDLCLTVAMGSAAAAECGDLRLVHALPTVRTLGRARTHPHPALLQPARPPPAAGGRPRHARLRRIEIPPASSGLFYEFTYAEGTLQSVSAPGVDGVRRLTTLARAGEALTLTDPDRHRVTFRYDSTSGQVTRRTDRRGTVTRYAYDAGGKLAEASLEMGSDESGQARPPIVMQLRALESLGLGNREGTGQAVHTTEAFTLLDGPRNDVPDHTRVWLDRWGSPRRIRDALGHETLLTREDSRFPALVTRVRYANGREVSARYDDRGNPETQTEHNPYGDGRNAITRYTWDAKWDAVKTITLPEGEVTTFEYDPTTGNRLWQQVGPDATRRVHFAYDAALGLAASTTAPGTSQPDSVFYDGLGNLRMSKTPLGFRTLYLKDALGRDTLIVSPTDEGSARDSTRLLASGVKQRIQYDDADQVIRTQSIGPATQFRRAYALASTGQDVLVPAETLTVRNRYDPEGNLERVDRWASPDSNRIDTITTRWRYDRAGRAVAELAPGSGTFTVPVVRNVCDDPLDVFTCRTEQYDSTYTVEHKDSTEYDPAGNAVQRITRRGHTISMRHDALNRLTRRALPEVRYGPLTVRSANSNEVWYLPRYRRDAAGGLDAWNDGTQGLTIDGDVEEFTYDEVGNLRTAVNRDARVHRRYHLNGTLAADTLKIRTYTGSDTTSHVYGLRFAYDLNGRRTRLHHPQNVVPRMQDHPAASDSVVYAYSATTGELRSIVGLMGDQFSHAYNDRGELERLTRMGFFAPGFPVEERWSYDADGRLEHRTETRAASTPSTIHDDSLFYDARAKVVRALALGDSVRNAYTGLGTLAWSYTDRYVHSLRQPVDGEELYTADALGNHFRSERTNLDTGAEHVPSTWRTHQYAANTGRLVSTTEAAEQPGGPMSYRDKTTYDAAGNKVGFDASSFVSYPGISYNLRTDTGLLEERAAFYYGVDGRLRVVDRRSCVLGYSMQPGASSSTPRCFPAYSKDRGAFEEHRYDALGRRILVRTRQEKEGCADRCNNSATRFVWDGAQILYEMRALGHTGFGAALEQDTGRVDPKARGRDGRVAYTHGLGIDRPLAIYRMDYDTLFPGPLGVYPHTDWRGLYDSGTFESGIPTHGSNGSPLLCTEEPVSSGGGESGDPPEGGEGGGSGSTGSSGTVQRCVEIDWPAPYLWNTLLSRKRDLLGRSSWSSTAPSSASVVTPHRLHRWMVDDPNGVHSITACNP